MTEVQETLAVAYARAGMPAHAHHARTRAGQTALPWQDVLSGAFPEGAKLADLLEFESARQDLLQAGPQSAAGLKRMTAFIQKFPSYTPAINITATGAYLLGQFEGARMLIDRALTADPRNIHALLNLARIERLLGGVKAVRALRPRVQAARIEGEDGSPVVGGELALAELYSLMEDAGATRAAVERGLASGDAHAELSPEAQQIIRRLERAEERPGRPLLLPGELLPPGWPARWRSLPPGRIQKTIESDLHSVPGWYDGIEAALLYESGERAQSFAALLLNPEFNKVPLPDGVSADARAERFLAALREEGGTTEGRLGVIQALQSLDLLPEDFVLKGEDGSELEHHKIELLDEPTPNPLTDTDQDLFERAHELMGRGKFKAAIKLYLPLAGRYPDFPNLQFNLAMAEEQIGTPALRKSAQERLERLAREQPQYLFAPAKLALQAVQDGDLHRAETLMKFPPGITQLHILEYGYFNAVLGVMALHKGDLKTVEKNLDFLEEHLGEGSMAYRLLEQKTIKRAEKLGPEQGYPVLRLVTGRR